MICNAIIKCEELSFFTFSLRREQFQKVFHATNATLRSAQFKNGPRDDLVREDCIACIESTLEFDGPRGKVSLAGEDESSLQKLGLGEANGLGKRCKSW